MVKVVTTQKLSQNALHTLAPGLHNDSANLYLQVSLSKVTGEKRRSWVYRYSLNHKTHDYGLGSFPRISLSSARKAAEQVAVKLIAGIDPIQDRKRLRNQVRDSNEKTKMTLKRTIQTYISIKKSAWTKPQKEKWEQSFIHHVYPKHGNKHIAEVDDQTIRNILQPIWDSKHQTAKQLRAKLEAVLAWAAYMNYRTKGQNPATWKNALDTHFSANQKKENRPALPYQNVKTFIGQLKQKDTVAARAFEFLILTAVRTEDAITAKWDHIDLKTNTWTIPGRNTAKMKKDFQVPLSKQAVNLIKEMQKIRINDYVFPGTRKNAPLTESTLRQLKETLGYDKTVTVHGFRSAFKDWCSEETDYPNEVSEMALAHTIANGVEAAYRRGELLKKRTKLMQAWADYIEP